VVAGLLFGGLTYKQPFNRKGVFHMAESISRIYLQVYETNKQFGKILLLIFLFVFVVPFLVIEAVSLIRSVDIPTALYARIQGMTAMQDTARTEFKAQPNPSFTSMPADRPTRVKGIWNAGKFQIANPIPDKKVPILADRPSRIKGVWNMMNGGIQ
jgi:hypothetical protein